MAQLRHNMATFTLNGKGIDLSEEVLQAVAQVHNEMRNPALID